MTSLPKSLLCAWTMRSGTSGRAVAVWVAMRWRRTRDRKDTHDDILTYSILTAEPEKPVFFCHDLTRPYTMFHVKPNHYTRTTMTLMATSAKNRPQQNGTSTKKKASRLPPPRFNRTAMRSSSLSMSGAHASAHAARGTFVI